MKIIKSIFYFLWIVIIVACQRKPDGLEIGIGRFQQLYAQGYIKELTYIKNDWVLVELQDEVLQQDSFRAEFETAKKNQKIGQRRFIVKMISKDYLNELLSEVKKQHPQARDVSIRLIEKQERDYK